MSEGTYEYECSRAELLGIEPPTYEEFVKKSSERNQSENLDEEDVLKEELAEAEAQNENHKGLGGKFDELNQILRGTQQKFNRFKNSYGSIRNVLKIRLKGSSGGETSSSVETDEISSTNNIEDKPNKIDKISDDGGEINGSIGEIGAIDNNQSTNRNGAKQSELSRALDMQTSNLDDLAQKAERAEMNMREQTNQMKKFLNFSFLSGMAGGSSGSGGGNQK